MKMVRSLLLGTAAGLVAVAGAQAADMPVKAKPVQYVKICTLYGDGFYYIPGTDICLKIGGYVRAEFGYNYGASLTNGPFATVSAQTSRTDGTDFIMRSRAYAWFDSRQQTEYGTLRTYLQIGLNFDNPAGNTFNGNRAFIQFAGFTVGLAQSFYDYFSAAATSYFANVFSSDTGDPGWKVLGYTATFGNGVSATVSIEEPRRNLIWDTNATASAALAVSTAGVTSTSGPFNNQFVLGNLLAGSANNTAKERFPDLVSNWRVDQAWGGAQIMFAAHDASGGYYGTTLTGSQVNGHPADKLGWAAGIGGKLNVGGGDYIQAQANYTQGALRYVAFTPGGAYSPSQLTGNTLGYGILADGVFNVATQDVQLTTAWGINAAYEHFWLPNLRTSLYGTYAQFTYNSAANASICLTQAAAGAAGSGTINFGAGSTGLASCNNDFNWWAVGSRTQWNITPWFYVGFDVVYQKLESASKGAVVNYTALTGSAKPSGSYAVTDQDNVGFRVRFHRDIVP